MFSVVFVDLLRLIENNFFFFLANDIKVRFSDGNWEAWGTFKKKDIHCQCAIAMTTPPYTGTRTNEKVRRLNNNF